MFAAKLMGTLERLTVADVEPQLRAVIATTLATGLGSSGTAFVNFAADQAALSQRLRTSVEPAFEAWGLECTTFFVESLSLPEGIRNHLRQRDAFPVVADTKRAAISEPDDEASSADPYAMIQKLHELLTTGAITQAEFDQKKTELLARIT